MCTHACYGIPSETPTATLNKRLETQIVTDKATGVLHTQLPGWRAFLLLLELSDNDGFDSDNWGEERERERFMHSICEEEHEIRYLANCHTPKTKQSPYSDTQVLGSFFNPFKTWYQSTQRARGTYTTLLW